MVALLTVLGAGRVRSSLPPPRPQCQEVQASSAIIFPTFVAWATLKHLTCLGEGPESRAGAVLRLQGLNMRAELMKDAEAGAVSAKLQQLVLFLG